MERISFRADTVDGKEHIMDLEGINPSSIVFNQATKEIFIEYEKEKTYEKAELKKMKATDVRVLVEKNGGEYKNKTTAIDFLISL